MPATLPLVTAYVALPQQEGFAISQTIQEERPDTAMHAILQDLTPERIRASIDANEIAYGGFLSTYPQAHLHNDLGICWFETDIPLNFLNQVLQTRLEPAALPATIDRIITHFQSRGLPFLWNIGPSSQPADLGDFLQARGIVHDEDEPGMAVDLLTLHEDLPRASNLVTSEVVTHEQLYQWTRVWGCGAPDWVTDLCFTAYSGLRFGPQTPLHFYLGTLDGEPVTTTTLFFGAGVASIRHVVTVHKARRQGIGAAMTLRAAHEARRQGYRVAVLHASPMGIHIYRRLGFREYCTFSTYEWYPTSDQQAQAGPA